MYNTRYIPADEILCAFGDTDNFRLEQLIEPEYSEEELNVLKPSEYYSIETLPIQLKNMNNFNVLSLNAQSINAKFDCLLVLIEVAKHQGISFHAICIQESWLSENADLSLLQIDGFRCYSQGKRCSAHGGLLTYISEDLHASKINMNIDPTVWEGLFIRIKDLGNQKDLVLGNIYRPPHDNNNQININTFVTELDPMLSSLTNNRDDFLIAGDFNINLLQINVVNKEHYAQFLDLMLAYSLFPKITFPTRTSESGSCTLIDNIFCKLSKETLSSIAGILYTSISDHYPYFLSFSRSKNRGNEPPSRYVKQRVDTESARAAYLADLMNSNIISQLNQDPYCDPNVNYDILHKHITDLKDKHLPFKLVKFNKYKHKGNKWITNGVLKSLIYKDRLYKQLRSTDKSSNLYPYLKQKFGLYNSLLKKLIRECKISYYHQQFHDNKSDIKKHGRPSTKYYVKQEKLKAVSNQ